MFSSVQFLDLFVSNTFGFETQKKFTAKCWSKMLCLYDMLDTKKTEKAGSFNLIQEILRLLKHPQQNSKNYYKAVFQKACIEII